MECIVDPTTKNTLKQVSLKRMDGAHNGNNIKMLINFNSKINSFQLENIAFTRNIPINFTYCRAFLFRD
jgi:hypothetical protein